MDPDDIVNKLNEAIEKFINEDIIPFTSGDFQKMIGVKSLKDNNGNIVPFTAYFDDLIDDSAVNEFLLFLQSAGDISLSKRETVQIGRFLWDAKTNPDSLKGFALDKNKVDNVGHLVWSTIQTQLPSLRSSFNDLGSPDKLRPFGKSLAKYFGISDVDIPDTPTNVVDNVQKLEDSINDYLNDIILENPSRDKALAVDPLSIALSDDGKSIDITELVIDENYRNQGLGTEVFNRIKEFADNNNLSITTTPLVGDLEDLVKKQGFVKQGNQYILKPDTTSNLSDDVAEVTNDFVYNKFAEKQRTADNVIFRELDDGTIELLVIKRKRGPHRSLYALPGGIVDSEIINDESIIRSIIDRPSFKRRSGIHKAIENYRLNNKELPGDNLKFAAEALREALEETGLTIEDIVKSAELDVKYNRFDWDARAAQGVDVGGIVIKVNNDWTPKAGDDALQTEWVKLQDVADGKVQLAFGHAEFVQEGFEKFYDEYAFEQTNPKKSYYGIYVNNNNPENIIKKLDDVSKENSQRNVNIIKESNPIRAAAGQPEIDVTNATVIDRQNSKLVESIYRMDTVPFRGGQVVAADILRPEIILNHILEPITNSRGGQSVWDVDYNIDESSFKDSSLSKSLVYGNDNFQHRRDIRFSDLTDQKQLNIKRQVQRQLIEKYRSFLGSLQNQGMRIDHLQIRMLEHFIDIVNSEDFDNLFNALMEDNLQLNINTNSTSTVTGLGTSNTTKTYFRNQFYNFVDSPDGDNIDIVHNNNVEELKGTVLEEPMNNILNTHTEFVNNTFPEGALVRPVDAAKDMNLGNSALLESLGITRSGDTITGMTYHGGNGLSSQGKEIFKEVQKIFPEIVNTEANLNVSDYTRGTTFNQTLENFINRVADENNLEWLDPRIDRQVDGPNLLRGNVFYTTSNPFLAASYSIGGFNADDTLHYIVHQSNRFYKKLELIINTPEFLGLTPDDDGVYRFDQIPERINQLDNVLKKHGLTIQDMRTSPLPTTKGSGILQHNFDSVFKISSIDGYREPRPILIDPFVTQIIYEAPVDSFLFTDGDLGPQMNSNIEKAVKSIVPNSSPEVWLTDQQIRNAAEKILLDIERAALTPQRAIRRPSFYKQYYSDIGQIVEDMVNNPSKYRQTFVNILNLYSPRNEKLLQDRVKLILKEGTFGWNSIPKYLEGAIFNNGNIFGEEIYPTIQQEYNKSTIDGFVESANWRQLPNAGELVLADKINEYLIEKYGIGDSGMDMKELDNFIKTLSTDIFGSDVIGRRDFETIKFIMEAIDKNPTLKKAYEKFFQQEILGGPNSGENVQVVVRRTISGEGRGASFGKGVTSVSLLNNRSNGLINFLIDVGELEVLDMEVLEKLDTSKTNNLLNEVYELRNTILDEGLDTLNLSKDEKYFLKFLIDRKSENINHTANDVLRELVNTKSTADYISLKSLSDGGIESTFGSGGASRKTAFHDTFYIVDPGNKFESNVPKVQTYKIKTVMPEPETLLLMHSLANGELDLNNLNLNQIEQIGEVVPIEHILNNQNISMEQKIKWQAIYTSYGMSDQRYASVESITPSSVDAPYLLHNEELKNVANEKLFNNVNNVEEATEVVADLSRSTVDNFGSEAAEQLATTGVARTIANGLDIYDAIVFAPIIFDLIASKMSGAGQYSDTIGGALADVATNVYDPEQTDTVFESVYGSPTDFSERSFNVPNSQIFKEETRGQTIGTQVPNSLAASASQALTGAKNITKSSASTIGNLFGVNNLFTNMWEDMKEGAASAFGTIADAHGLNDWIYNFKKDMYVTSVAKQSGINPNSSRYKSLVESLENQYESQNPKIEDRFGNPLDNEGDS